MRKSKLSKESRQKGIIGLIENPLAKEGSNEIKELNTYRKSRLLTSK